MDPMTIGALIGLGKSLLVDYPNQAADAQLQATTAALSPWTGLHAAAVKKADPFGDTLSGGLTGKAFGDSELDKAQRKELLNKQLDIEERRLKALEKLGTPSQKEELMGQPRSLWTGNYSLGDYGF